MLGEHGWGTMRLVSLHVSRTLLIEDLPGKMLNEGSVKALCGGSDNVQVVQMNVHARSAEVTLVSPEGK